jgi:molybdenum cofactor guanylyltransferase
VTPRRAGLTLVILAGGRSTRFGRDKLRARVGGRPALARVVARAAPLATEVIVTTSTEARRQVLSRLVPATVRFLLDRPGTEGPEAAMEHALASGIDGPVLFLPGDIPWVETRALERFVRRSSRGSAPVAAPGWASGQTENLIQWHAGPETLRFLPGRVSTSGRASEFLRAAPLTRIVPVAALTRRAASFAHLNLPSDLTHPARRGRLGAPGPDRLVGATPKRLYRRAHRYLEHRRRFAAARSFALEARWYARSGLGLLAQHAFADAVNAAGNG